MTDVFNAVKSCVTMRQAAENYGLHINRSGFVCCPFHNEKTASMKIYDSTFHCFGCGEHGDIISFYQKLYNLKPIEAVRLINDTFCCGLSFEKKYDTKTKEAARQRKLKAETDKLFEEWERSRFIAIVEYLKLLRYWKKAFRPSSIDEQPHELFILSLTQMERVQYLCDLFTFGSLTDKHSLYLDCREEVNKIYDRMQQFRRHKAA